MCHFLAIQDREVAWGVSAGALRFTRLKLAAQTGGSNWAAQTDGSNWKDPIRR
jgi:hypothetical protein